MRGLRPSRAVGGCAWTASRMTRLRVPVLTRFFDCLYIDWARFSRAFTFLPVLAVMKASGMYDIERKACWTTIAYLLIAAEALAPASATMRSHLLTTKMQGLYCL